MSGFTEKYEGEVSDMLEKLGISDLKFAKRKDKVVGYIFHPKEGFIFILPKIYKNKTGVKPDPLTIYRALKRYDEDYKLLHKGKESDSTRFIDTPVNIILRNEDDKNSDFLDIIIQLFRFNRENRHFIITELNQIRGYHRIDWRRTIRKTMPTILDGEVAYFNPLSRKIEVNNTESLLVMFYSILNYLHTKYPNLSERYEPEFYLDIIPVELISEFIEGGEDCQGLRYLNQIRTQYSYDKALNLWNLCHAFFSKMAAVSENSGKIDYLLASDFNPIFERMVDDLLSDIFLKEEVMTELKKHGRYLDHIYKDKHPLTGEDGYFIGDSKYYGASSEMDKESEYKQYDYANYLVQALFNKRQKDEVYNSITDSYLPIINFFIRGGVGIDGGITTTVWNDDSHSYWQYHFADRLFDRNTQLVLDFTIDLDKLLNTYIEKGYSREKLADKVKEVVAKEYMEQITQKFYIYKVSSNYPFSIFNNPALRGKLFLTKQGKLFLSQNKT